MVQLRKASYPLARHLFIKTIIQNSILQPVVVLKWEQSSMELVQGLAQVMEPVSVFLAIVAMISSVQHSGLVKKLESGPASSLDAFVSYLCNRQLSR